MTISEKAQQRFTVAMARAEEADEILAAIQSGSNPVAPDVAALGGAVSGLSPTGSIAKVSNISTGLALSTSDTYTDAAVNTAVNSAVNTAVNAALLVQNQNLLELQTKVNAILTALKTAGLMS